MNTIQKISIAIGTVALAAIATVASAHVVVKPSEAGVAAFQTFTVGVPAEKDIPSVGLRLVLPAGLKEVSPTVKPGWNISMKKTGTGDDATVTEIDWTGGSIPAGLRDDFSFSAQVPSTEGMLVWKAYQTYQDGSVVSWDKTPGTGGEDEETDTSGPYSQTKIINDLSGDDMGMGASSTTKTSAPSAIYLIFTIVSLALSIIALQTARKAIKCSNNK